MVVQEEFRPNNFIFSISKKKGIIGKEGSKDSLNSTKGLKTLRDRQGGRRVFTRNTSVQEKDLYYHGSRFLNKGRKKSEIVCGLYHGKF